MLRPSPILPTPILPTPILPTPPRLNTVRFSGAPGSCAATLTLNEHGCLEWRFKHAQRAVHIEPRWDRAPYKAPPQAPWRRPDRALTRHELLALLRPFAALGNAMIAGGAVAELSGAPGHQRRASDVDIFVYALKVQPPDAQAFLRRLGFTALASDAYGDREVYGRGDMHVSLEWKVRRSGPAGAAEVLLRFDLPPHRVALHPDGQLQDLRHLDLHAALERLRLAGQRTMIHSTVNRWEHKARAAQYPIPAGILALIGMLRRLPDAVRNALPHFNVFINHDTKRGVVLWQDFYAYDLEGGDALPHPSGLPWPLLLRFMVGDTHGLCILHDPLSPPLTALELDPHEIRERQAQHHALLELAGLSVECRNLAGGWPELPSAASDDSGAQLDWDDDLPF